MEYIKDKLIHILCYLTKIEFLNSMMFLSVTFLTSLSLNISAQYAYTIPNKSSVKQDESCCNTKKLNIEKGKDVLMMTYFRQRNEARVEIDEKGNTVYVPLADPMLEAKLHIALSTDGRCWVPINDNKPVWDQWMRDPYVSQGPDGQWHLLSTGGKKETDYDMSKVGPVCLYSTSKDLINWKVEKTLPLMKDVLDESGAPLAQNIWAPEWFYDVENEEYILIWSSSFQDRGWKESRLWYSKTRNWKEFTPAKVLFEPPYSVIDGTLLKYENTYYLFHKEEEFGAKKGERRAMRLAISKQLEGPYEIVEGHLNEGQIVPVITEGPSVIKDPLKPGWLLYYDYFITNRFGVSHSKDLIHWRAVDDEEVNFPSEARHASVSKITAKEAKKLINAF